MLKKFWAEFKEFAFKGNMIDLAVAVVIGAAFSGVINSLVSDVLMPGLIYITSTAAAAKNEVAKTVGPPATKPAPVVATPEEQAKARAQLDTAQKAIDAHYTPMVQAYKDMKDLQAKAAMLPEKMQTDITAASGRLQDIQEANGTAAAPPAAAPAAAAPTKPEVVKFDWMLGNTGINLGRFVGALINFVIIALAVFITIVKLLGTVMKRMGPKDAPPSEPVTKECPFCLSIIPIKARKCSHCTADLPAVA